MDKIRRNISLVFPVASFFFLTLIVFTPLTVYLFNKVSFATSLRDLINLTLPLVLLLVGILSLLISLFSGKAFEKSVVFLLAISL